MLKNSLKEITQQPEYNLLYQDPELYYSYSLWVCTKQ